MRQTSIVILEFQIVQPALKSKQMPRTSLYESQLVKQDWPYSAHALFQRERQLVDVQNYLLGK